jgi:hypothetical protein
LIRVKYNGTHGNKLWQYAVARLYAEIHGYAFYADTIDGLPNTKHNVCGVEDIATQKILHGHKFDLSSCDDNVLFDGFFQRYEYVRGNKEKLSEWFAVEPQYTCDVDNGLVLSIRRGWNGYPTHLCPPSSFYSTLLKSIKADKIYLCTDSFDDEYFSFLNEFSNVVFYREHYLKQFDLIRKAKTVILSPSTFCWWAAYLGNADKIFYPWYSDMIPTEGGANWWVDDDARYERVNL